MIRDAEEMKGCNDASEEQMKLHVWTPESAADCQEKHLKLFPFMLLKAMVLMWCQK